MNTGVTIYGASSARIDHVYLDAARQAGYLLASKGIDVVCGGGRSGVMGEAIDGALEAGGAAIGVLPQFMVENGWQHPGLTRMVITPDMHSRKKTMASMSMGAIAMPGGVGTLEELLEIITWRQLGLYHGNVVILNINGYYDPLLEMLGRTIEQHFMNPDHASLWSVATTVAEAVEQVTTPAVNETYSQKL
ncbi:MAG: TIGR00730 family Rossman fold protein [Clostridiales bacterium]|nr:TIGR00730 family Rossman fold protein [Clostridiales bacterium]